MVAAEKLMGALDLAVLTAAISPDEPCGADLDAEDDDAYASFMSSTEMVLPDEYMVVDHTGTHVPFHTYDRFKDLDFGKLLAPAIKLTGRTHDLRLLFLIAKLQLLKKSLADFQVGVEAVAGLLETFWVEVHPRDDDGHYGLRMRALERFDEPLIVSALNNAPLFISKYYGVVTGQTYAAAAQESVSESANAPSGIDRRLRDESQVDLAPLMASRNALDHLDRALRNIRTTTESRLDVPLNLQRLPAAVDRLAKILDRILPPASTSTVPSSRRLPDVVAKVGAMVDRILSPAVGQDRGAAEVSETGSTTVSKSLKTTAAAAAALAAAADYLAVAEPSSPAILLLRQAQALIGKSFLEALEALAPDKVRNANLNVDRAFPFDLPVTQLAEKGQSFAPTAHPGKGETLRAAPAGAANLATVASRADALECLDHVVQYFRRTEPSSPVPLLIETARALVGQDFLTLLKTVLS